MSPPPILMSARLRLRPLVEGDVDFLIALYGDPDFIRFVGDRGIRDRPAALAYLRNGAWASYEAHGFGPWAIERLGERGPIGICGLYRRATLDAPDLGYALLPAGRGRGFAREAGRAALEWAEDALGLRRILAITTDEHRASQRVLEALGMHLEGHVRIPGDDADLRLYATAPADSGGARPAGAPVR
ncbi:MAG: GNAT family N-acetyltransferase [Myxococcales bacterium]|nr:GNAT family N-acetyltransferase [Myxococcales bacterium]